MLIPSRISVLKYQFKVIFIKVALLLKIGLLGREFSLLDDIVFLLIYSIILTFGSISSFTKTRI